VGITHLVVPANFAGQCDGSGEAAVSQRPGAAPGTVVPRLGPRSAMAGATPTISVATAAAPARRRLRELNGDIGVESFSWPKATKRTIANRAVGAVSVPQWWP
jgi:hypothetical protein